MEAEIRPANAKDTEAVRECVDAAYSKYIERMGKKPAPMLDDYESLTRAGDVWILAEDDEVFGLLVMRGEGDHLFVENVAVSPDRQGHGLGRPLMTFADKKAAESGLPEVKALCGKAEPFGKGN